MRFWFPLVFALCWCGGMASLLLGSVGEAPSVDEILERALQRADWYREERIEHRFTASVLRTSEKLGKDGEVVESEEMLYQALPIDGYLFERLVSKNGRSLSEKEVKEEVKREEEFREKIRNGEDPTRDERSVNFDQKLVNRYVFNLESPVEIRGRQAHVLSFKPKGEDLPVETRMDRALNKAEGRMWIDIETYEIAKVHFQLKESIRIWWGLIGSISELDGTVERAEVAEGIWLPNRVQIYLNGRILFMSLHRNERIEWTDFEPSSGSKEQLVSSQ